MALTDPARELAATLELIGASPDENLDDRIAKSARVQAWSADFFRVIFEILARFSLLEREINQLPLDDDIRSDALQNLHAMAGFFSNKNILSLGSGQVRNHITGSNPTILKMLSPQIRERVSYHLFTAEERSGVLADVRDLIGWLEGLQSEEKDFVREALIAGLRDFEFRLDRLEWFGSGYSLKALRDVIHAYMALQGAGISSGDGKELMDAILLKTKTFVIKVLNIVDVAKDTTEKADWALRAYGAISALADGSAKIAGLLN
jgi:hypothetical protein